MVWTPHSSRVGQLSEKPKKGLKNALFSTSAKNLFWAHFLPAAQRLGQVEGFVGSSSWEDDFLGKIRCTSSWEDNFLFF